MKSYTKNDRIVVNAGTARKPEYYLATVNAVSRSGDRWKITFDDGERALVTNVKDIAGHGVKRKHKTAFGREDLERFLVAEEKAPAKPSSRKTTEKKKPATRKGRGRAKRVNPEDMSRRELVTYLVGNETFRIRRDAHGTPIGELRDMVASS